jgi:hypothetical protein
MAEKRIQLKLHEAMIVAMVRKRSYSMTAGSLADLVGELDLYRRPKDNDHAPGWQLVRRAGRYPQFFALDESGREKKITLRRFGEADAG